MTVEPVQTTPKPHSLIEHVRSTAENFATLNSDEPRMSEIKTEPDDQPETEDVLVDAENLEPSIFPDQTQGKER